MKLTAKINILFSAIVSSILLIMAFIVFRIASHKEQTDFRLRLLSRARNAGSLYSSFRDDPAGLYKSLSASLPGTLVNKNINIYDNAGKLVYEYHDNSTGPFFPDSALLIHSGNDSEVYFMQAEKEALLYRPPQDRSLIVAVAAEDITGKEFLSNLQNTFLVYVPLAILLTLVAGYIFSRRLVRPIRQTINAVNQITSRNLSSRLHTGKDQDELAELNRTINDLLNRLEESFSIQKRFIANASHELSTPLTSVSSQVEVALLHDRNSEEYKRVLLSVLEDVKGLHQLTRNLLELAKASNTGDIELMPLRIDELVVRSHSEVRKQHPGFSIRLELPDLPEDESRCIVFGNPHLLHIAIKNIMENGCKYSPDKSVTVDIQFGGKYVSILFTNRAENISPEELNQLFEPFYRRTGGQKEEGFGLGLTLTRRIIGLHKGSVEVASQPEKGTISFRVLLPVSGT